jgi:hypothetical protein
LAFAEQRRGPDCPHAERSSRCDIDADRLGKTRSLFDPSLRRAPRSLTREFGDRDDRALAAGNLDRTITVEGAQESASPSSAG